MRRRFLRWPDSGYRTAEAHHDSVLKTISELSSSHSIKAESMILIRLSSTKG